MAVDVRDNPAEQRYEITVDGEPAGFSQYRGSGELLAFTHTEIDPAFEGRGLGTRLVAGVIEDLRDRGVHMLPLCPFIKAYLADHPDDLDVVAEKHRAAFGLT